MSLILFSIAIGIVSIAELYLLPAVFAYRQIAFNNISKYRLSDFKISNNTLPVINRNDFLKIALITGASVVLALLHSSMPVYGQYVTSVVICAYLGIVSNRVGRLISLYFNFKKLANLSEITSTENYIRFMRIEQQTRPVQLPKIVQFGALLIFMGMMYFKDVLFTAYSIGFIIGYFIPLNDAPLSLTSSVESKN